VRRYLLRVPADQAEPALARMLELFPDGVVEEREGDLVVVSGYAEHPPAADLESEQVQDGWAERWREHHRAARVGRLWIGPPWLDAEPDPVVIDPGHAFGTGAHGSTRAALELLQRTQPGPALDLGCGSGVLSIAALRLGFGPIRAFDIDPLAVDAASVNAARNGVEFEVALADVLADPLPAAPLWIANLQLDLLERLLRRPDVPPLVLGSGMVQGQTLAGLGAVLDTAAADGWVAELVAPGPVPGTGGRGS
jgi:ribosomal protein L11 methyltransferase